MVSWYGLRDWCLPGMLSATKSINFVLVCRSYLCKEKDLTCLQHTDVSFQRKILHNLSEHWKDGAQNLYDLCYVD